MRATPLLAAIVVGLALVSASTAAQPISQLPAASSANVSDVVPATQGGVTRKVTVGQINAGALAAVAGEIGRAQAAEAVIQGVAGAAATQTGLAAEIARAVAAENSKAVIGTASGQARDAAAAIAAETAAQATANAAATQTALSSEVSRATSAEAAALHSASNLSDLANTTSARTNLGLGGLATLGVGTGLSSAGGLLNLALPAATSSLRGGVTVSTGLTVTGDALAVAYGTSTGTAAQGNDGRITGALQTSTAATTYAQLTSFPSLSVSTPLCGTGSQGSVQACLSSMVLPTGTTASTPALADSSGLVQTTQGARTLLAAPPAIGGTTPGPVTATTLTLTGSVSQSSVLAGPAGAAGAPTQRRLGVADVTGSAESGANSSISSLTGLTTPLPATEGGTGDAGGAWTSAAITPTPGSGAFTSASGTIRYRKNGRSFSFEATISITTNGTAASYISFALPASLLAAANVAGGGANMSSAAGAEWYVFSGTGTVTVRKYDSSYPGADNTALVVSGTIETTN